MSEKQEMASEEIADLDMRKVPTSKEIGASEGMSTAVQLVQNLFDAIDSNHDGKVSKKEVLRAFRDSESDATVLVRQAVAEIAQQEQEQKCSREEQQKKASMEMLLHPKKYADAFVAIDTNESGFISIDELMSFCINSNEEKNNASEDRLDSKSEHSYNQYVEEKEPGANKSSDSHDSSSNENIVESIRNDVNQSKTHESQDPPVSASASYAQLERLCSTMQHLDSDTLLGIRDKIKQIGARHEELLNSELNKVDMRKIVQFQSTTRSELLALTAPPEATKSVMYPLCTLLGMKRKWRNVRRALSQLKGGSAEVFSRFRELLQEHIQHDPVEMSLMLFESPSVYDSKNEVADLKDSMLPLPSFHPLVDELRLVVNDPNLETEKLASVSMAAASLSYMYSGLVEYADIWRRSYEHRRVTDLALRKIREIDRITKSIEATTGPSAAQSAELFREQYKQQLTSALRRSAALHTVLGSSVSSLPGSEIDKSSLMVDSSLKTSLSADASELRPYSANADVKELSASERRRMKREALIKDPFPKVKHDAPWQGSPSSFKHLTYSSSSNHFIVNLQEVPRHAPPLPGTSHTNLKKSRKKRIRRKRKIKSARNLPRRTKELSPLQVRNGKRGGDAQEPQVSTLSLEDDDYYADDFDAGSPGAGPDKEKRPGTAPQQAKKSTIAKQVITMSSRQSNTKASKLNRSKSSPMILSKKFRSKKSKSNRLRARARPEWVGSPSTYYELTYSSTSNRTIVNIQAIPSKPPRILGIEPDVSAPQKSQISNSESAMLSFDGEGSSVDEFSSVSCTTSLPSKVSDILGQSKSSTSVLPGKIFQDDGGPDTLTDSKINHGKYPRKDFSSQGLGHPKWVGSPSSRLPFTFSRTANRHFTQKQMWPQYDATKDPGCAFTKTLQFRKFSRKQERNREREILDVVDERHRKLRIKQRGALAAAVAMTEAELPTDVDDQVSRTFDQISEKIYTSWRDRRGLMMTFPDVIKGFQKSKHRRNISNVTRIEQGSYISEEDLNSAMHCIGLKLSEEEFQMFCCLLYPKSRDGQYNCLKAIDLVMAGDNLLSSMGYAGEETG